MDSNKLVGNNQPEKTKSRGNTSPLVPHVHCSKRQLWIVKPLDWTMLIQYVTRDDQGKRKQNIGMLIIAMRYRSHVTANHRQLDNKLCDNWGRTSNQNNI